MSPAWPVASAAPGVKELFADVAPWLGALLVLVGLGAIVIYALRRWMGRGHAAPPQGFTLQELRELHAARAMTGEEFDRAKASIIGRLVDQAGDKSESGERGTDTKP